MSVPRSVAVVLTVAFALLVLAACGTPAHDAATAAPPPSTASPAAVSPPAPGSSASESSIPESSIPESSAPATSAPVAPSPASATAPSPVACASAPGAGLTGASITVCPAAGPVGSVVHVSIKGCAPSVAGQPGPAAAALFFLGPNSWLGTNGGEGASVTYTPATGPAATAAFTVPATYTGGNENGPYPTLAVSPGTGYEFITDPAGACHVPFTVTKG